MTEHRPENDSKLENNSEIEEAPEGGWGWMVAFAFVVAMITTFWPGLSFTFVFGDFLEDTGQAGSIASAMNSVIGLCFSLSSMAVSPLLKHYSMRSLGIFGAFLFAIPNILMSFVSHATELMVSFVVQGIGLGLVFTILNINFNAYFVKKRSMVMSISQVIIGLGGIIYPMGTEKLMEEYGYRGTSAILGALNLHCIFAMTLMRPPPGWNCNKPAKLELPDESEEPLVMSANSLPKTNAMQKWDSRRSLQVNFADSVGPVDKVKNPWSSLTSLGVQPRIETVLLPSAIIAKEEIESSPNLLKSGIRWILPTEYLDLAYDRAFMVTCLGMSFTLMSDFAFSSFLPMIMASHGYSKANTALAVTTSGAGELASRICLAVFTTLIYQARPKHIFFVAMVAMTLVKLGYMCFEDTLSGTLVMVGTIGVIRSWLLVPQTLVIVEDLRVDQFAAAYGISGIVGGVISVTLGPFAGFVKDWTGNFFMCQILLIVMNSVFIVPWGLEIMLKNKKKPRLPNK